MIYPRAYVGLGSNLGDRADNLARAVEAMSATGLEILRESSIYETEPIGVSDKQPWFLNMVVEVGGESLPAPAKLLGTLHDIEAALGRMRDRPLTARTIDLDLLTYGSEVISSQFLVIPHPRAHLRRFVLLPLCELAANDVHAGSGMTFGELLGKCWDPGQVRLWKPARTIDVDAMDPKETTE